MNQTAWLRIYDNDAGAFLLASAAQSALPDSNEGTKRSPPYDTQNFPTVVYRNEDSEKVYRLSLKRDLEWLKDTE